MFSRSRTLDRKLSNIAAGNYSPDDFVLADAKDADMAYGVAAAGLRPGLAAKGTGPGRYPPRAEFLDSMRELSAGGELDIMLTSAYNGEQLVAEGALGESVTLAVRANDTSDIWNARGGNYPKTASRPFRTVHLPSIRPFCDLVLYSMTFNNDLDLDLATLEAYGEFRHEAAALGIRHFLEVFNPNAPVDLAPEEFGGFVNDSIVRALAGVASDERPAFLKVAYNGDAAMRELVEHDSATVVGILGGSPGTTRDAYELLRQAESSGARVALFGRKIQRAESQPEFVKLMRPVLRGELTPADAVRAYHDVLGQHAITPYRSLDVDLKVTDPALSSE